MTDAAGPTETAADEPAADAEAGTGEHAAARVDADADAAAGDEVERTTADTQATPTPGIDPTAWNIVAVADVVMELPRTNPEVVLHEAQHPWRELRIPVALPEGAAIASALRGVAAPRPLTHDLFVDVLGRHDVTVAAVRITHRRGQVFFAELDTTGPRGRRVVPCRPSDGFAIALRHPLPVPLLVAEWVFTGADEPPGLAAEQSGLAADLPVSGTARLEADPSPGVHQPSDPTGSAPA